MKTTYSTDEIDAVLDLGRSIQMSLCIFVALCLVLMWRDARSARSQIKLGGHREPILSEEELPDIGLMLLAIWFLVFSLMAALKLTGMLTDEHARMLSVVGNVMAIAILPSFTYGFAWVRERIPIFRNNLKWLFVSVICLAVLLVLYEFQGAKVTGSVDVAFSMISCLLLGYAITIAFYRRDQFGNILVFLSVIITLGQVASQWLIPCILLECLEGYRWWAFSAIVLYYATFYAQVALILLLAQNWVFEQNFRIFRRNAASIVEEVEDTLTDREFEVFENIDLTNQEIALRMSITIPTVKKHLSSIRKKLNLESKAMVKSLRKDYLDYLEKS